MGRPAKLGNDRRTRRLTIYLDKVVEELINNLAAALEMDKTKLVIQVLKRHINDLHEPPEQLRRAKQEESIQQDRELVSGFLQ